MHNGFPEKEMANFGQKSGCIFFSDFGIFDTSRGVRNLNPKSSRFEMLLRMSRIIFYKKIGHFLGGADGSKFHFFDIFLKFSKFPFFINIIKSYYVLIIIFEFSAFRCINFDISLFIFEFLK